MIIDDTSLMPPFVRGTTHVAECNWVFCCVVVCGSHASRAAVRHKPEGCRPAKYCRPKDIPVHRGDHPPRCGNQQPTITRRFGARQ